jgi:hypothetical protein
MPTPWDDSVKNQTIKDLGVFAGPDLKKEPAWGPAMFAKILDEFNKLSSTYGLGVTLSASLLSPKTTSSGAEIQLEVSSGSHRFVLDGQTQTGTLPGTFAGITHKVIQGGMIQKAFSFVPARPMIAGRGIGNGAKIALALHELLHAIGLDDTDPGHITGLDDPDLFDGIPNLDANYPPDGNPGDRLDFGHGKYAPPYFLTARTASLVRSIWS